MVSRVVVMDVGKRGSVAVIGSDKGTAKMHEVAEG